MVQEVQSLYSKASKESALEDGATSNRVKMCVIKCMNERLSKLKWLALYMKTGTSCMGQLGGQTRMDKGCLWDEHRCVKINETTME